MSNGGQQWLRKVNVIVFPPRLNQGDADAQLQTTQQGLDFSQMRIRFDVQQADRQTPDNASIRIYNLSRETVNRIRVREFSRVILQAGYERGTVGTIFRGEIKQYGIGREGTTDSYLDLFAADGDLGYNFGVSHFTLAAGSTFRDLIDRAASDMGMTVEYHPDLTGTDREFGRGRVAFGMSRAQIASAARTLGATWSIQNGVVRILPLHSYWPGEAVVINSQTGMLGIPTQTAQGVVVRRLIDPKLRVGCLVQIKGEDVNQIASNVPGQVAPFPAFNRYGATQAAVRVTPGEGLYRVMVVDREGDTHGEVWTDTITCIAVDPSSKKVTAQ